MRSSLLEESERVSGHGGEPKRRERRRRRGLRLNAVLRQRVPPQVERRLEVSAASAARHGPRLVNQPNVLPQVGRVAVAAAALRARDARRAAAALARCTQPPLLTLPPGHCPAPSHFPPPRSAVSTLSRDGLRPVFLWLLRSVSRSRGGCWTAFERDPGDWVL